MEITLPVPLSRLNIDEGLSLDTGRGKTDADSEGVSSVASTKRELAETDTDSEGRRQRRALFEILSGRGYNIDDVEYEWDPRFFAGRHATLQKRDSQERLCVHWLGELAEDCGTR